MYFPAPGAEKSEKCKVSFDGGLRIRFDPPAESIAADGAPSAKTDNL
jgi:hypothetical protein